MMEIGPPGFVGVVLGVSEPASHGLSGMEARVGFYLAVIWMSYMYRENRPSNRVGRLFGLIFALPLFAGTIPDVAIFDIIVIGGVSLALHLWGRENLNPFEAGLFTAVGMYLLMAAGLIATGASVSIFPVTPDNALSFGLVPITVGADTWLYTAYNRVSVPDPFMLLVQSPLHGLILKLQRNPPAADTGGNSILGGGSEKGGSSSVLDIGDDNELAYDPSTEEIDIPDRTPRSHRANRSSDGGDDEQTVSEQETPKRQVAVEERADPQAEDTSEEEAVDLEEFQYGWEKPPETEFSDIGGYADVKTQLDNQVIGPMTSSTPAYERFDVEPAKGVLFHGPPGTGKTLFARAVANNLNRPFVELNAADLVSRWINASATNVASLFEEAEELGGVVFIDEAETLFGERGDGMKTNDEDQKVTTTLLQILSGDDQNFTLILTTNLRNNIDPAVLRQGRIDLECEIGAPDMGARYAIWRNKLEEYQTALTDWQVGALAAVWDTQQVDNDDEQEDVTGATIEGAVKVARLNAANRNGTAIRPQDFSEDLPDIWDGVPEENADDVAELIGHQEFPIIASCPLSR